MIVDVRDIVSYIDSMVLDVNDNDEYFKGEFILKTLIETTFYNRSKFKSLINCNVIIKNVTGGDRLGVPIYDMALKDIDTIDGLSKILNIDNTIIENIVNEVDRVTILPIINSIDEDTLDKSIFKLVFKDGIINIVSEGTIFEYRYNEALDILENIYE